MFGTIGHIKVKPGKFEELEKVMGQDDRQPDGHIAYYVYKLEGKENEYKIAVVFRDKKSYFANADSPEQDEAYRNMVALLEEPPTWEDGEIVANG
jgi:quinol monooxygenase YgiN